MELVFIRLKIMISQNYKESSELQRKQRELLELQVKLSFLQLQLEPWKIFLTGALTAAAIIASLTAVFTLVLSIVK